MCPTDPHWSVGSRIIEEFMLDFSRVLRAKIDSLIIQSHFKLGWFSKTVFAGWFCFYFLSVRLFLFFLETSNIHSSSKEKSAWRIFLCCHLSLVDNIILPKLCAVNSSRLDGKSATGLHIFKWNGEMVDKFWSFGSSLKPIGLISMPLQILALLS